MTTFRNQPGNPPPEIRESHEPHVPQSVKRMLPSIALNGLRELKARIVTRGIPRRVLYMQSAEDALASASMSIVVPVHDAPTVTRRCLTSLEQYAAQAEIILVDDGSKLAETKRILRRFSDRNKWKLIHHQDPIGHSAACWSGTASATRDYLCLLNSDTVVTPWCWLQAKEVFEADLDIGVAGPSTSHSGTEQTLKSATEFLPYLSIGQVCNFAGNLLKESIEPAIVDMSWVSGFALFIRRSLWQELEGFDRNLPDYGNEVELCKRVAAKGYRVVWIRNSYIHHYGSQSYRDKIGDDGIMSRIKAASRYAGEEKGP